MKLFYLMIYLAGTQTKISLNSKITKNKFSTLERSLNKYLIFMVVILLTEMVVSTILSFSLDYEFRRGTDTYLFSLSRCSVLQSSHHNLMLRLEKSIKIKILRKLYQPSH